jgi:hypothetical protein
MIVFGFSAHTPAERLRDLGAHLTFTDMRTLPQLLRAL